MSPGRRSHLFREVNNRIYELLVATDPDLPGDFLCECGRDCGRRAELLPAAFATLRETGGVVRSADCRGQGVFRRSRRATAPGGVPALG